MPWGQVTCTIHVAVQLGEAPQASGARAHTNLLTLKRALQLHNRCSTNSHVQHCSGTFQVLVVKHSMRVIKVMRGSAHANAQSL
jgi:hypothetical protein